MWQRRGVATRVPAAGTDQRAAIFGALDPITGTLTTQIRPVASTAAFLPFLEHLLRRYPDDRLMLVLDNASYHKSNPMRHWFADHRDRVAVLFLPTYSPQLNLIERVWRFIKSKLACHAYWNDLPGLIDRAQYLLDHTIATVHADRKPGIRLCQNLCSST
jgi:transposase